MFREVVKFIDNFISKCSIQLRVVTSRYMSDIEITLPEDLPKSEDDGVMYVLTKGALFALTVIFIPVGRIT